MSAIATQIGFWVSPVKIEKVIEASELRMFRWKKLPEHIPCSLERVEYSNGEKTLRATFAGGLFVEFTPKKVA